MVSPKGSVAEYVGRTIDLLAYHGAAASGDILLDPTFAEAGEAGRVTTGIQKLAQRFIIELFREQGSTPFWPNLGTTFLTEARFGEFRTQNDVIGAFARAVSQVKVNLQAQETDDDPDDERFLTAEVLNVEVLPGRATIRALLVSRAGRDRAFIFPITVPNIPAGS